MFEYSRDETIIALPSRDAEPTAPSTLSGEPTNFAFFLAEEAIDLLAISFFLTETVTLLFWLAAGLVARALLFVGEKRLRGRRCGESVYRAAQALAASMVYLFAIVLFVFERSFSWLLLPLSVSALVRLWPNCTLSAGDECEAKMLLKCWRVFVALLLWSEHATLALKFGGLLELDVSQAFWVYWIGVAALLAVATVAGVLALFAAVAGLAVWLTGGEWRVWATHAAVYCAAAVPAALLSAVFEPYLNALAAAFEGAPIESAALRFYAIVVAALLSSLSVGAAALGERAMKDCFSVCSTDATERGDTQSEGLLERRNARQFAFVDEKANPRFLQRLTATYFKVVESVVSDRSRRRLSASKSELASRLSSASNLSSHSTSLCRSQRGAPIAASLNVSALLCNVCFGATAEAVFAPCGHGGLCLRCAEDICAATGECFLCRAAIGSILRYDSAPRPSKALRVLGEYRQSA